MVFLAITPDGLKAALREAATSGSAVWCGADAVSEEDHAAWKGQGLSRFNHQLADRGPQVLKDAIATIEEHHPGETVWVEASTSAG